MRGNLQAFFYCTELWRKRFFGDLNPPTKFSRLNLRNSHKEPVNCFSIYKGQFTGSFFVFRQQATKFGNRDIINEPRMRLKYNYGGKK